VMGERLLEKIKFKRGCLLRVFKLDVK